MGKNIHEVALDTAKEKVANWIDKSIKYINTNWDTLKTATNREKKETIVAAHILQSMILGKEVSDSEKRFLKAQSGDIIKILFLVSLKFIPAPIPFTPIAIFLGKKVGVNVLPSSHDLAVKEDLRKWFGSGKTGGWDRYNTKGEKVGKCGDSEEGSAYAACLSNEKSAKLGKDGRASFVKRKRAAQSDAGDAKKGGEQKKGQKPTLVKTGASEGVSEDWSQKYKNSIDCNNPKGFSQKAHCAGKNKTESIS
jgi:hypothetical protein